MSTRERSNSGRGESSRGGRDASKRGGHYEYSSRSPDAMKKRGDQSGGDFDKYLSDDVKAYKVADGDNIIRFLPPTWNKPEHFGLDIYLHYGVGPDRQSYLCLLKMKEEPCPICEERARAQKDGDEKYAKDLEAKKRVLVYLIDRNNEKAGVQAWGMPWTVDRDICKISVDKRSGETLELDNPEDGYDVEFEKKGAKDRTEYLGIAVSRRSSELGKEEWLDYALDKPLDTILHYYDYAHINTVFGGGSSSDQKHKKEDLDDEQEKGLRESEDRGRKSASRNQDQEYSYESIHGMTYDELCSVIDAKGLDINPDESKDDDDLADWICDDMKLEKSAKTSRSRVAPKEEEDSPKDRLARMRNFREGR